MNLGPILLDQGLGNFFYKRPDSNYSRLCGPFGLCHSYSTVQLQSKSSDRQCVNKWDNKTSLVDIEFKFLTFLIYHKTFLFFLFLTI